MARILFRRIASAIAVLPVALLTVFLLLRITGNPVEAALGDRLPEAELQRRIEIAGLNKPLYQQFIDYLFAISGGNFGKTFKGESAAEKIYSHLATSIEVTLFGLLLLAITVLVMGILAVWFHRTLLDNAIVGFSLVSFALPGFLSAVVVRETFSLITPQAELLGRLSLGEFIRWQTSYESTGFILIDSVIHGDLKLFGDATAHLILPAISLVFIGGTLVRIFRDSLLDEMNGSYIQAAMNRGVPKNHALLRHALVPSLPPVIAAFGITAGSLVTGVVFIEKVFEIKGLGYLLVEAVLARDFMLVQGIFIVTFLIVLIINFIVDWIVVLIDRRQGLQLL